MSDTTARFVTDLACDGGAVRAADLYCQIIEASPGGLLFLTPDGKIALLNHVIETMFGYDRAELFGRPVEILVPQRYHGVHRAFRAKFTDSPSTRAMGAGRVILGQHRDGHEFPVEIGLNPIMLDGGLGVVAAVADISARVQAEQERESQRQDLERSNADLADFAHAASHDLKAPLRGMAHLAHWIADDVAGTASPQTLENCALLIGRAARLQRLLDGLLAYARVGRGDVRPETFDTAGMIEEIVGMLALRPGFSVDLLGEMPTMTTPRVPLERVLQNLIENAVKHHDRATGRVVVSAERAGRLVRFSVSDDGPGIAPRYHKRIFQIFQTLASRDDHDSSGIGLAIVKKKVELYGGTVTVASAPPARGTCFSFTWPDMSAA